MSRLLPRISAAIIAILLVIGAAVILFGKITPQHAWEDAADPQGVPADVLSPADIVDARRAAGEAGTQAAFLLTGTNDLVKGVLQLSDGAAELGTGVDKLSKGAQELSQGMVQLQAATGQLGKGATELADGVNTAADNIAALGVVQGQMLTALNGVEKDIQDSLYPNKKELLDQLHGFRAQLEAFDFQGGVNQDLKRMKDGSRELANQLAVPGYGFHDGIYSATKGAKTLSDELGNANNQVGGALDGINQLKEGTEKINTLAEGNKERITQIQRSLPAVQAPAAGADTAAADAKAAPVGPALAPTSGFLLAALVLLGGAAAGLLAWRQALAVGVVSTLATAALFAILATGSGVVGVGFALLTAALLCLGSFGLAAMCVRYMGTFLGGMIAMLGVLVQLGLVGWVWKTATISEIPAVLQGIAGLMPLHYGTAALTSIGNAGDPLMQWGGMAVVGIIAVAGFFGSRGWGSSKAVVDAGAGATGATGAPATAEAAGAGGAAAEAEADTNRDAAAAAPHTAEFPANTEEVTGEDLGDNPKI
ncbi:hypothetical protein [Corynebacterium caspium]|uniref:hypothetical protein n=1 Tax=Corynebacterium caspium TaxID=234828 RepID=UPI000380C692|nr:hypothetical protein [Corynebacterium caspium]WKD58556.1 hypothetical protein CCASP_00635 [Corynebacterium caspium DSM 44850]